MSRLRLAMDSVGGPALRGSGRGWRGVFPRLAMALAALFLALLPAGMAQARPNTAELEQQLRAEIATLASDDFAGREPGTEGEAKTLRWLAHEWFNIGLVSGTNDPGHPWFAPVELVAREPAGSSALFTRRGRAVPVNQADVLVLTSGRRALIERAPLLFLGHGEVVPARTELAGRVALLLDSRKAGTPAPGGAGSVAAGGLGARQNALLAAGALGVITVLDGERTLAGVIERRRRQGYALASEETGGDLEAFISAAAMDRLLAGSATSLAALQHEADGADFVPRPVDLAASLEATTRQTTIRSHNLIGLLPGRHRQAGAVLVMAHWDHFGTCASPPAEHLICNGAVDNASGVAALTEIARRLAHPPAGTPPLDRDIYFLATTAEEMGLLGAEAFAENPPLPLSQVVAALNLDCVAIAPAGGPLGMVGKGQVSAALEAAIATVAHEQRRSLSASLAPNTYIRRQDGWALMAHDVPAVMVTSAYGDIARLEHYFDTDYHRPQDVMKPGLELGGAAQDVLFHVALVHHLADMRRFDAGAPANVSAR